MLHDIRSGRHAVEASLQSGRQKFLRCIAHEWDHARTTQQRTEGSEVSGTFHFIIIITAGFIDQVINAVICIDCRLLLLCLSVAILASGVNAVSLPSTHQVFLFFACKLYLANCNWWSRCKTEPDSVSGLGLSLLELLCRHMQTVGVSGLREFLL